MGVWFAASTGGFYLPDVHAGVPSDAVEITEEEHGALLAGQAAGQQIVADEQGAPVLIAYVAVAPVPAAVTMRQLRRAMRQAGSLGTFEAALAAMAGAAGEDARIDWSTMIIVPRNDPLVGVVVAALGLTDAQRDDLLIAARAI